MNRIYPLASSPCASSRASSRQHHDNTTVHLSSHKHEIQHNYSYITNKDPLPNTEMQDTQSCVTRPTEWHQMTKDRYSKPMDTRCKYSCDDESLC